MDSVLSKSSGEVAAVKRAQIIQRVLVDGWSPAQTAAVFAVPERRIARWVEDYRRRGMASLRDEVPGERVHQRWLHALTGAVSRCYAGLRRGFGLVEPAPCVVLRRTEDGPVSRRLDPAYRPVRAITRACGSRADGTCGTVRVHPCRRPA